MKKNVLYVGVDVDDNAYNASIYNPLTDETEHFKCRPTAEGLVNSRKTGGDHASPHRKTGGDHASS